MDLTVVIITKNEEKNIGRCLESVKWASEIIVVDSGSTDKTVEIAKSYNAIVISRHWPGYGPQKFFGISQATNKWCLVLDADEELTYELAESIKASLLSPVSSCYKIHRRSLFLGKVICHGDWGKDWIVRLFDKTRHQFTQDIIHEKVNASKKNAAKLSGKIIHYTQDNITQSLNKMNIYSDSTSKILIDKGKSTNLIKAILHKNWTFFRSYFIRFGFLDGIRGYLIAKNSAYGSYYKYVKMIENQLKDEI